jgi:hypothetical protein
LRLELGGPASRSNKRHKDGTHPGC